MKRILTLALLILACAPRLEPISQTFQLTFRTRLAAAFAQTVTVTAAQGYILRQSTNNLFLETEYRDGLPVKSDRLGKFRHRLLIVITEVDSQSQATITLQTQSYRNHLEWRPSFVSKSEIETFKRNFVKELNAMFNHPQGQH